jgi:ribonuclease E
VFAVHRIDEQLAKAMDRKVWLPSGGTLVIDRTEAMTVVDVNTGKFTGAGGNLEQTVTRNNLEAAEEIVRQLRLRDIGGIIVVDFIDMVLESNRDLVLRRLTEALARDRTRHQVSEVTSLGLVQLTRKRLGTGLIEAFSTQCTHCAGRGILLHADPVDSAPSTGRKSDSGRRGKRGKKGGKAEDVPVVKVPAHSSEHPMFKAMQAANGKHEDDDGADEETTDEGTKAAEEVAEADTDAIEQAVVDSADEETEVDEVDEDDDSDDDDDDDDSDDDIDLDDVDEDEDDDDDIEVIDSDDDDSDDEDDDEDDDDSDDDDEDDDDEDDEDEDDDDDEDDDREEAATATVGGRRPRRRSAARPAGPPSLDD